MKKIALGIILAMTALTANAGPKEKLVSSIVKKYSEAVACQLGEGNQDQLEYKTLLVKEGFGISDEKDIYGMDATYLTFWQGDYGCSGGNGTMLPQFTTTKQNGFMSTTPVVVPEMIFPQIALVQITGFQVSNGVIFIKGLEYGEKDRQHNPTKKMTYKFKYTDEGYKPVK